MTDLFAPLDDHPAYRQIANLIEERIVARSLRTGDALPSDTDLARQFGVDQRGVEVLPTRTQRVGHLAQTLHRRLHRRTLVAGAPESAVPWRCTM